MQQDTATRDRLVLAGRESRIDSVVEAALHQLGGSYEHTGTCILADGQRLLRFGRRSELAGLAEGGAPGSPAGG